MRPFHDDWERKLYEEFDRLHNTPPTVHGSVEMGELVIQTARDAGLSPEVAARMIVYASTAAKWELVDEKHCLACGGEIVKTERHDA